MPLQRVGDTGHVLRSLPHLHLAVDRRQRLLVLSAHYACHLQPAHHPHGPAASCRTETTFGRRQQAWPRDESKRHRTTDYDHAAFRHVLFHHPNRPHRCHIDSREELGSAEGSARQSHLATVANDRVQSDVHKPRYQLLAVFAERTKVPP